MSTTTSQHHPDDVEQQRVATVVADMSMSLDGFIADSDGGVDRVFAWYAKPQPPRPTTSEGDRDSTRARRDRLRPANVRGSQRGDDRFECDPTTSASPGRADARFRSNATFSIATRDTPALHARAQPGAARAAALELLARARRVS
ncbi:MAG: hypothetical protein ACLP8S_23045 [Solirubrobacteraceae bacterium]